MIADELTATPSPDVPGGTPSPDVETRSRRSLLVAALGGIAGALATAVGRPAEVRAAAGDPLLLGQTNYADTSATRVNATSSGGAFWMTQFGSGSGVRGDSVNGHGGVFTTGHQDRYGLQVQQTAATAGGGAAIYADGGKNVGISATTTTGSAAAQATNSGATGQPRGVEAYGTYAGVHALGATYGVYGSGTDGVYGVSNSGRGVNGYSSTGTGVQGFGGETNTHSLGIGVFGSSASDQGTGVRGQVTSGSGTIYGVYGESSRATGYGVYGWGPTVGVHGFAQNDFGVGVEGVGQGSSSHGVAGSIVNDSASSSAVYGSAAGPSSFAGYFDGKVTVTGTLSKGGGSFRIDHPLDPANRILQHSFVESPDMKNVYDGVATTDADGRSVVSLPGWFEALNREFRYQLTPLGGWTEAWIDTKIRDNRFVIRTRAPGRRVSWQVTGIRKDAYASANPIEVEVDKKGPNRGRYLNPVEHGQPQSKAIGRVRRPEPRS